MGLKGLLRPLVPRPIVDGWRASKAVRIDAGFAGLTPAEVFGEVYRRRLWSSTDAAEDYCSGTGSHDDTVVRPYVGAVRRFLQGFPHRPAVTDLGCGDFNVGALLRDACGPYVACDVVAALIDRNARKFAHLNVEFRQIDVVADPLPDAEIAFLRQVLQHLSNAQIAAVLAKLHQYSWVVITEHLPAAAVYSANVDKPTGPGVRASFRSGVVVTRPPFDFRPLEQRALCSIVGPSGIIETTAYRLHN
jgi:hypothetical protein